MKKEFVNRNFTDTLGYAFTDTEMPKMRVALGSSKEQATTGLQPMQVQQVGQLQTQMTPEGPIDETGMPEEEDDDDD